MAGITPANVSTQVLRDGARNFVIRLSGEATLGTDTDQTPLILVDVTTLHPPCLALRVDRVKFSLPNGSPLDISLWWQATTNQLFWGMSGGDDNEFSNFGGLTNNASPGATGNIMWGATGLTGNTTEGTVTLTFAVIVECTKLQPIVAW